MWASPIWSIDPSGWDPIRRFLSKGEPSIDAGPAKDAASQGFPLSVNKGIGVVRLLGPMMKSVSPAVQRAYGLASTRDTEHSVLAAGADADIEVVLLAVDSPGGSVDGLSDLGDAVSRVARSKPVYAQVDGMAASAAYYAIAGATEIRAGRMDLIGSIGTRMTLYDFSGMFGEMGVEALPFDTGPLKSAGEFGTKITDEQKAYFQGLVDTYFADFKRQVASGRKFGEAQMKAVTTGGVWTTGESMRLGLGLVDKVSSFRETYAELLGQRQQRGNRIAAKSKSMQMRASLL